jgi:hypothetical protein
MRFYGKSDMTPQELKELIEKKPQDGTAQNVKSSSKKAPNNSPSDNKSLIEEFYDTTEKTYALAQKMARSVVKTDEFKIIKEEIGFATAAGKIGEKQLTKKISATEIKLKTQTNTPRAPIRKQLNRYKVEQKALTKSLKKAGAIGTALEVVDFIADPSWGKLGKAAVGVVVNVVARFVPVVGIIYWGGSLLGWW